MSIKLRYIVLLAIALLIGVFLFGGYVGQKRSDNASEPLISTLNGRIRTDSVEINNKTVYISEVEQELLSEREARRQGEIEKEELRKLNIKHLSTITRLNLRIDTLLSDVTHTGTTVQVDTVIIEGRQENALLLPFDFSRQDEYLDLFGTFSREGQLDIDILIDSPVDLWLDLGNKKNPPKATVTSESTYINILSVKSINVDFPKPKKIGVGFHVGYGISNDGLSPYIGAGLSYNIISF